MSHAELRTDVVIVACAISAGIHAALAREHFRETALAGAGFVVAALLLAALAIVLTRRPTEAVLAAAALVLAGLIGSYVLAVTSGIPLLHPDVDPVEGLAVATKVVETLGLVAAAAGLRRPSVTLHPKGALT